MDLSRWAEVVGITAVVISLVFVGIELRQNTATNAAQAMLELSVAYSDREMSRIENRELSEIIRVGHSDPDALVPDQRVRYEGYLYSTASLADRRDYPKAEYQQRLRVVEDKLALQS